MARTAKLAVQYPVNALNRIEGLINTYENKNKEVQDKIEVLESFTLQFSKKELLKETEIKLKEVSERINKSISQDNKNENAEEFFLIFLYHRNS